MNYTPEGLKKLLDEAFNQRFIYTDCGFRYHHYLTLDRTISIRVSGFPSSKVLDIAVPFIRDGKPMYLTLANKDKFKAILPHDEPLTKLESIVTTLEGLGLKITRLNP